ncbi:UDP-N-acetylglucosamine 1-carboxyvinyltransferase [Halobacteroides halobius DSM 5150]|uniref:UDP-N-acetylglucosamine 1-carboxyvinyltransferase n=1 Tax=Halobacteroides halobius (strain ATCC 35273 / DSM 5150 / MD-1) TaxID=748449 RepID=L0K8U1_HALHC|nr:UDP-N-acetylglucosamine 1-carboxyvinyltransferase [Halobacteroides halobius]AGB41702.1 UDP-N-acetylglucosamine 1-carboxyvinyltransferase [Halobacteroides halobius DSM 5150]
MARFVIEGGKPLEGEIDINGAKNAVLPILAGTVLAEGQSVISRVPNLRDVRVMKEVLTLLGSKVEDKPGKMIIDTKDVDSCEIPQELMQKMRASVFLMGPLVARFGQVEISQPGGCSIGSRPIDLHLKGLEALGVEFTEDENSLKGKADELKGAEIHLDFPSVGATENIMMAATKAKGLTKIYNAAREPEIVDLQNFLNKLGANIKGAGTDVIKIKGVEKLHAIDYRVIPDRIEAGTFLIGAAITGGQVIAKDLIPVHIESILAKLSETGVKVETIDDKVRVTGVEDWQGVQLKTLPYPGFPTDMQPQFMTFLSIAEGRSVITETIFDNRLQHAKELNKMGANIEVNNSSAIVNGVAKLSGTRVEASDLRAGAALILAGLSAEGKTKVDNIYHIDRGYENIEDKLTKLGANIIRVK